MGGVVAWSLKGAFLTQENPFNEMTKVHFFGSCVCFYPMFLVVHFLHWRITRQVDWFSWTFMIT